MTTFERRAAFTAAPKMIFLDQGVGKLIKRLVAATAAELGPVVFLSPELTISAPDVTLINMPGNVNRSARSRLLGWARYLVKAGWAIVTQVPGRPVLFIVSNPPVSPILGVLARKLKRQRYILLFYDMYPEAIERFRGMSTTTLVSRAWRALNALSIRNAAAVVTISPDLAQTLGQYYPGGAATGNVEIVPTWADTDVIYPRPKAENWFAQQYGQDKKLTVFYSGNIGAVHDLAMLPAIANQLRDYDDVHFLIIGDGVGRGPLQAECARLGLHNVTFLPLQPEDVLPFSLATADVSIIALARGGEGVSMPSKTYYMMAAGSALLGLSSARSDLAAVITRHNCGINIEPGNVEGAVQAILRMRNDPELLRLYRENGRSAAVNEYSAEVCIPRLIALFKRLLGE